MYSFLCINERTCTNVHVYIHICIQVKQTYSLHTYHSCTNENLYKRVFIYVIIYIYIYKCRYAEDSCWLLLYPARSHYALRTIVGIPLSGLEWFIHVDQLFS